MLSQALEVSSSLTPFVRGESVRVIVDYDLFGNNTNDKTGIYLKTDKNTKKFLVYFPEFEEWGELLEEQLVRESPGYISDENLEFISRVKTLEYTFQL